MLEGKFHGALIYASYQVPRAAPGSHSIAALQ